MLTARAYQDSDRACWDEYVRRSAGSHFGQLIAWKELIEENYPVTADYRLAENGSQICGVLPVFRMRGRAFSAPGGLLAEDEPTASALLEPFRGTFLELRDQHREWPGLATNKEHVTLVLDLPAKAEMLWGNFDTKLRTKVRRGEKAGFVVRRGHEFVDAFYRVMLENMRDLGTPIRNARYYRRALEKFGNAAEIIVIEHAGQPAGAIFLVAHGETLMDPWSSCRPQYLAERANEFLYWEALKWAIERGFRHFDFGRSQWESGTFHFKRKWGAQPVALFYQYTGQKAPTLAEQKKKFDLAVKLWKRLPLPLAGRLGEHVKKLFPEAL